ncbi:nucleotide sugar dehydrogenase [Candidatus Bathyarchaeota archaeon]|nr:nucleotide sugar dehydrogenase [Candidatus Bathyarchaeota archaeon]
MGLLRKKLLNGDRKIGVWGTGYIGFSTMANYAANGVSCLGTDVAQSTVDTINQGRVPILNLEYWLGFPVEPLVRSGMMRATTSWKELLSEEVVVHMIAIPTEKDDKPWDDALIDVTKKISTIADQSRKEAPLVIIESTLTPNRTNEVVIPLLKAKGLKIGEDICVGVAPRRDWFISPEKNLKNLPRIVGGTTPATTEMMMDVLGIVCDRLVPAPDHRHAEIVKSIENAYRHVEITLANQLSLAFPDIDMVEVLKLVGTKWNIGVFHPSLGTGGYCIPLSSKYLLSGAKRSDALTILRATIETDEQMPRLVAEHLARRGAKRVGILGLAYKSDLKVHTLSPTLKIVPRLKEKGVEVKVHDPYYSEQEIEQIVGTETFIFPEGLREFDAVVIVAGHRAYRTVPGSMILKNLGKCKLIVDNIEEAWRRVDFSALGIEYHVAGDRGWLGS